MQLFTRKDFINKCHNESLPHYQLLVNEERRTLKKQVFDNKEVTGVRYFFGEKEFNSFKRLGCYNSDIIYTPHRMEKRRTKTIVGTVYMGFVRDVYVPLVQQEEERVACFADSSQVTMTLSTDTIVTMNNGKETQVNDGCVLYVYIPQSRFVTEFNKPESDKGIEQKALSY